jgi:glyoxylase-like metal-dependent hydrolase (beta-lactamase superfamily II)
MKHILTAALLVLLFHSSSGQNSFIDSLEQTVANIKEELVKIKEGYYVIQPQGIAGNIVVYTGTKGVIMVDDQWARVAPRIKELIGTITDKPIRYIINTHFHFDHVDGNKIFGKENIIIIAHKNLRKRLSQDQVISGGFGVQKAYPAEGLPTLTFSDSLELYDGKETIRLVHFPHAHTDGDAVVHFVNADIYHTGDIFVTYGLPVLDENNGGDIYEMIKTIDYLLAASNSETRFVPGHGPVCSVKELAEYRKMLVSIKDQVVNMMKKRLSLERIMRDISIDKNIGGVDKKTFISHVYRMASKHEKISTRKKSM